VTGKIEEIIYLLSKHKEDKTREVNYTHEKTTRELEESRVHSRRREADSRSDQQVQQAIQAIPLLQQSFLHAHTVHPQIWSYTVVWGDFVNCIATNAKKATEVTL
jgi:hypothetical protein